MFHVKQRNQHAKRVDVSRETSTPWVISGSSPKPAAAAAARGVRGVISAAGSADRAGRAIVAGAGARAAVRGIRIARSAHRAGVPAAGVAAGIGDEAGEYDTAIDTVITHNVRPPEISLGDCLRSIL